MKIHRNIKIREVHQFQPTTNWLHKGLIKNNTDTFIHAL